MKKVKPIIVTMLVLASGAWAYHANLEAVIAKYDNTGKIMWEKSSAGVAEYSSVTTVFDGVVAVGRSGYGEEDTDDEAIIVKYNNSGNIVWEKRFAGAAEYSAITTVPDGVVVVGKSSYREERGGEIIIVKYSNNGNVIWKKSSNEIGKYSSVTAVAEGVVVAGMDMDEPFNATYNAVIAKYDNSGEIVWKKKKNIGWQCYVGGYSSVTTVSDGVVAVGISCMGDDYNAITKTLK